MHNRSEMVAVLGPLEALPYYIHTYSEIVHDFPQPYQANAEVVLRLGRNTFSGMIFESLLTDHITIRQRREMSNNHYCDHYALFLLFQSVNCVLCNWNHLNSYLLNYTINAQQNNFFRNT
jgi:hypothetical protein